MYLNSGVKKLALATEGGDTKTKASVQSAMYPTQAMPKIRVTLVKINRSDITNSRFVDTEAVEKRHKKEKDRGWFCGGPNLGCYTERSRMPHRKELLHDHQSGRTWSMERCHEDRHQTVQKGENIYVQVQRTTINNVQQKPSVTSGVFGLLGDTFPS
jgi:hypothetical protein